MFLVFLLLKLNTPFSPCLIFGYFIRTWVTQRIFVFLALYFTMPFLRLNYLPLIRILREKRLLLDLSLQLLDDRLLDLFSSLWLEELQRLVAWSCGWHVVRLEGLVCENLSDICLIHVQGLGFLIVWWVSIVSDAVGDGKVVTVEGLERKLDIVSRLTFLVHNELVDVLNSNLTDTEQLLIINKYWQIWLGGWHTDDRVRVMGIK